MSLSSVSAAAEQQENLEAHEPEATFLQGIKDAVPTLLGYLSIGLAAGVVEKTAGLSVTEIALLSILLYAGSGQFIFAGMIGASTPSAIIFTIFFVNLRHILMSAALSPYFRHLTPFRNMLIGTLLTDETFGVAINQPQKSSRISERWMHGLNITAYLNWVGANIVGAYAGQWIKNPGEYGLDFALPAMFIGLLVLQMVNRRMIFVDLMVAAAAVLVVVGISMFASASMGIIAATLIGATFGMVVEKWK